MITRTRAARRPNYRLPQLERMEHRVCPAITTSLDASTGVLTVTGNAADDTVQISSAANGDISVTGSASPFSDVSRINVNLGQGSNSLTVDLSASPDLDLVLNAVGGAGTDQVTLNLGSNLTGQVRATANLGFGDDSFTVTGNGIATGGRLDVNANGSFGNDTMNIDVGAVAADATLNVNANLGLGDDTLSVSADSVGDGADVSVRAVGGLLGSKTVDVSLGAIGDDADVTVNAPLGFGFGFGFWFRIWQW
jgi:hypothetical protein